MRRTRRQLRRDDDDGDNLATLEDASFNIFQQGFVLDKQGKGKNGRALSQKLINKEQMANLLHQHDEFLLFFPFFTLDRDLITLRLSINLYIDRRHIYLHIIVSFSCQSKTQSYFPSCCFFPSSSFVSFSLFSFSYCLRYFFFVIEANFSAFDSVAAYR